MFTAGIDIEIMAKQVYKIRAGNRFRTFYISKSIVEAHDGKIRAGNNSDGEEGAIFAFSLPLSTSN
jgi:signal transduction histidine kinase